MSTWNPYAQNDRSYLIAQITGFIEEQARRRFEQNQRQMERAKQLLRLQQKQQQQQTSADDDGRLQHYNNRLYQQHAPAFVPDIIYGTPVASATTAPNDDDDGIVSSASFTYVMPAAVRPSADANAPSPFAVGPNDPRFYESSLLPPADVGEPDNNDSKKSSHRYTVQDIVDYNDASSETKNLRQFYVPYRGEGDPLAEEDDLMISAGYLSAATAGGGVSSELDIPVSQLKAPMEIKVANGFAAPTATNKVREDINQLVQKLQTSGQAGAIINGHHGDDAAATGERHEHVEVVRKQMEMNTVVDMYVVAIIAGISASVTVGLIAIGIGWYT